MQCRPGVRLSVVTSRARGPLHGRESKLAFGRAVLSNALSRSRLARHLERVVFQAGSGPSVFDGEAFDEFGLVRVNLDTVNVDDALLASGTIPTLASPVRDIAGAPAGLYRDGALVDYHLLLPYQRLRPAERIVFYPHFNDFVTPGWLDKHLPWRRSPRAHPWLDDVLLVAPAPAFLATLPHGQAARPAGPLSLRARSRRPHPRVGNRHWRVRPVCRGGPRLDGTAGSDVDRANRASWSN